MEEKKVVRYKLVRHKWPDEIAAQKQMRKNKLVLISVCIAFFVLGVVFSKYTPVIGSSTSSEMEKFNQVYEVMKNKWYFGKDMENLDDTLIDLAINGMVDGAGDLHTMYMDAETAEAFTNSLSGNFVGIGIQYYAMNDSTFIVDKVFKNSPADEAGIVKGDQIHKVNDQVCEKMTTDQIAEIIRGAEGTKVKLQILREGKPIDMEVERREVNNSVFGEVEGSTGVLEINTFAETSGTEVGIYLEDFKAQQVKNLIIDLRDNGGGYLKAALEISSYLLPDNTVIFKEENKQGKITEYQPYPDYTKYEFDKIVVLVNNNTASASEVLTSSLQEYLNAKVVGTKTYGKGTVQVPLPFKDGSSIKYTTAEWLSPSGKKINNEGITPDYEVKLDPAVTTGAPSLKEGEVYKEDTVSSAAKTVQVYLKFLGYDVDRTDEYFSLQSAAELRRYQQDNGMEATGEITADVISALLSSCSLQWHDHENTLDTQKIKAMEVVNGK